MYEPKFADQALNSYTALEVRIKTASKGLFLLVSYFFNARKQLEKFCEGLQSSLSPLLNFLHQDKENKDSLNIALNSIIQSEAEYYSAMKTAVNQYQTEVIDVLDLFVRNYENKSKSVLSKGSKLISLIESQKARVLKARDNYNKSASAFYNAVGANEAQISQRKKIMEDTKSEYQNLVDYYNDLVRTKSAEYKKELELIEQNEETRISITGKSFSRFFSITQELADKYSSTHERSLNSIKEISPRRDIELAVLGLSRVNRSNVFDMMIFEDYGETYQYINLLNYDKRLATRLFHLANYKQEDNVDPEGEENKVKELFKQLLKGKEITNEDKEHMINTLSDHITRRWISDELSNIKSKCYIKNISAIKTLAQLLNNLLTVITIQTDTKPLIFCAALSASFLIYSSQELEGKFIRIPLRQLILNNNLWQSKKQWIDCIQYRLVKKLAKSNLTPIENKGDKKSAAEIAKSNMMKKSLILDELCAVAEQMALMDIEKLTGREILLRFAGYYGINSANVYKLLLGYEAAQVLKRKEKLTPKEIVSVIKDRYKASMRKYVFDDKLFIIAKSLSFVDNFITLRNVLVLNKLCNKTLKKRIYKKALSFSNIRDDTRYNIWNLAILDTKLLDSYVSIKETKLAEYKKTSGELVKLDVNRSFQNYGAETREVTIHN